MRALGLSIGSVITILRGIEVLAADIEAHYGGPFGGRGSSFFQLALHA